MTPEEKTLVRELIAEVAALRQHSAESTRVMERLAHQLLSDKPKVVELKPFVSPTGRRSTLGLKDPASRKNGGPKE